LASPYDTLVRRAGKRAPLAAIHAIVREHDVGLVIVGLPDTAEGADLQWVEEIRGFARKLERRIGVPVRLYDEAFSTVEAMSKLEEGRGGARVEKGRIDAVAATIILQEWLDQHAKGD